MSLSSQSAFFAKIVSLISAQIVLNALPRYSKSDTFQPEPASEQRATPTPAAIGTHLVENLRTGARPPPARVEVVRAVRLVLEQELGLERALDSAKLRGRVDLAARLLDG